MEALFYFGIFLILGVIPGFLIGVSCYRNMTQRNKEEEV